MDVKHFIDSIALRLVLFNPLLMSAYLLDVMKQLNGRDFVRVVGRAFLISGLVFMLFDVMQQHNERLVERYAEIIGRASALLIGTIAIEMIFKGVDLWLQERA